MSGSLYDLHRLANVQSTVYDILCVVVKNGPEKYYKFIYYTNKKKELHCCVFCLVVYHTTGLKYCLISNQQL